MDQRKLEADRRNDPWIWACDLHLPIIRGTTINLNIFFRLLIGQFDLQFFFVLLFRGKEELAFFGHLFMNVSILRARFMNVGERKTLELFLISGHLLFATKEVSWATAQALTRR